MVLKRLLLSVLVCLAGLAAAQAQNVFVLPSGTTAALPIGVFSADPFAASATVQGPASPVAVFALPNGSKYYVIARGAADTLTVLDANFNVIGAARAIGQAQAAALSPDGRYLLILANNVFVVDTTTDQVVRTIDVGGLANDVAFSIEGTRAFVVSSTAQRVTAIDLASLSAVSPTVQVSGGSTPTTLAVAPNGFLYAAGQNIIREIDARTMTIRAEIPIIGNPGKLAFSANAQYAIAPNLVPSNGNSTVILIDLATRTVARTINTVTAIDRVVYGGRNASGQERVFAFSRSGASIQELALPALQLSTPAFAATVGQIGGIAISNESPSPRFLFVAGPGNAYRISLSNDTVTGGPLALTTAGGDIVLAGAATTTGASSILVFNNNQSVVASTGTLNPIVVRVVDATGRPVADAPITFTSPSGNVTFSSASTRTSGEGFAVVTPNTPTVTGTYTITAASGSASTDITFNVTGGTTGGGTGGGTGTGIAGSSITVISGSGQLVTQQFLIGNPIRFQVRNAAGAPVANAEVVFSITSGATAGQISPGTATGAITGVTCSTATSCVGVTDANGMVAIGFFASAALGGQPVQTVVINAATGGVSTDAFVTVIQQNAFVGREIQKPARGATIEVRAGQTVQDAVRAVFYSFGVGANQFLQGVGLSITTGNDAATGPTVSCAGNVALSAANGIASCDLVAGPVPGEASVNVLAGGNEFPGWFRVRVLSGGATRINITGGNNQSGTPGQTLGTALTAQLVDANGQPVSGQQVVWELTSAGGAVLAAPTTSTSDAQGRVSTRLTLGNTPGTYQVRVGVPNTNVVATFSITVGSPLTGLTAVSGGGQATQRGSAFGQPLVARVAPAAAGVPVTFTVSSGSATLSAQSATTNTQGEASVTVTAGNTAGPVIITATAGGQSTTFSLTVSPPGPQFTAGNLVDAASFIPVPRIAPGMLLTITGTGLAPGVQGTVGPPSIVGPYPVTLAGVEVLIGGLQAPILHVSNSGGREQVTVQVPFELPTSGTTSVTVRVQGGSTTVQNVPLAPIQPGIFETEIGGQRWAVLIRQDGSFVTPSSPARRGEVLRMFVHGLGGVSPTTATNQAGTGGQQVNASIIVGVNSAGVPGRITAEYVEGFIGLYLVTFEVPGDAPSGRATLSLGAIGPDGQTYYSNTTNFSVQ
ncbi:MAG TPA: Ig-like domain-containing protein [Bryobacteraceae bacterium]|nr:Ig-like domain-containing protein [Bryobacteraceae bacterium]